ncbi:MAG: hypothetical protein COA38_21210 [Fluviicola sp.]|nr:MAG: hypothetical protein COA38_21210 [Fluviicola sp.]
MNRIIFTYTLLLISCFLCSSNALEQDNVETVKIYASSNNSKDRIKIIEGEYGISRIYFLRQKDAHWMKTDILSIDTIQEYLKVKLTDTNEIFELFIEWNSDKMTVVDTHKKKVIYWLKKS